MIDYVKFDTTNNVIIVGYADGTTSTYTQAMVAEYLETFPDRASDIKAMGWLT